YENYSMHVIRNRKEEDNMNEARACRHNEFRDIRTGKCKNADDVYRYEAKNQNIKHDIIIDGYVKKYTKRRIINELVEFRFEDVAKELVNMVSRKKIDLLPQANKRVLAWADYWLNEYNTRGITNHGVRYKRS
ncbi:MAG: hypothetical protein KAW47_10850, partial [Thermoplasmatales archaeon]|nr:hypothetical protein [Thermoplasmatales archaeon]